MVSFLSARVPTEQQTTAKMLPRIRQNITTPPAHDYTNYDFA